MKRVITLLLICALIVSSLCACSNNSGESSDDSGYRTVTDHLGIEVKVPQKVNRIAVTNIFPVPSVLCVFFGSAQKIVEMAPASMTAAQNSLLGKLYPDLLNVDTSAVDGDDVNIEELLKQNPDLVIYSASTPALGEKLRNAGIAAVALSVNKWNYDCIETLNHWLEVLKAIFPDEANDRCELVKKYSDEAMKLINERVSTLSEEEKARVFVLFQYSDSSIVSSGKNFFGQWWAQAAGAINVAEELEKDNSVPVTLEQIYKWNPDTILMTNFNKFFPDDLYNNTVGNYDWSQIDAIKNKRVFKMPLGMYRSYTPGIDTPVTLKWMAKTIYPSLFEDIDIIKETVDYYKDIFNVTLTDEEARSIFEPKSSAGVI
ncbi:MAG: ABC transporter substrate-binding protein [Lachnospiraceae bacterium]|nr:ABC transporter substrate-binding protein [Lachnospiraceae bacterium]